MVVHDRCRRRRPHDELPQRSRLDLGDERLWTGREDKSNGEAAAGDGKTITLNGTTYPKGLGTNANSDIRFDIAGKCTSFSANIGVDDEVGTKGSVIFKVFLDGTKAYDSGTMTGSTATKSPSINLTGKNQLRLYVDLSTKGNSYDHADWANARITCTS